jgi:hypothetical protein
LNCVEIRRGRGGCLLQKKKKIHNEEGEMREGEMRV